jgi:hypothetical protein
MLKFLRIAFSLTCSLACLALITLWVQSQQSVSGLAVRTSGTRSIDMWSLPGSFSIGIGTVPANSMARRWDRTTLPTEFWLQVGRQYELAPYSPIWGEFRYNDGYVRFPHWFAVLLAAALGVAPWLKWRRQFSLRTLLVATTIIAAILGAIVASK